jgi:hypothetical protein
MPKLLARLKNMHPNWLIGEKRLRRVRQELKGKQAKTGAEIAEGMDKHTMWEDGEAAGTVFTAKDHPAVNVIGEDGTEMLFMPMLGEYMNTGRRFKKDVATGGWVL